MPQLGVLEAKTHLSSLIESLEGGGEPVVITRHGKPVAKLVAVEATPVPDRIAGLAVAERLQALRDRIARECPELNDFTWEDAKAMARK